MSSTIDQRVVEMKFNNSQFEAGAKQSMNTLDKLKKSLDLSNAAKSFEALDTSFNKISFAGFGNAIDSVKIKFSALESIAFSVLQNITNKAVDAGERLVKSLSIDQITSGYSKYEEKVQGVQTIMAATGKSIEEVNASIEKLNWFTDETSYNFTDMISSIGKFTSAGMDLDDSVTAMEGIANWAAVSGVNAQKASSAYYNIAQAISTGAMKLQDWKSIQNINMNTKEFQQTVIDTALELGTLKKVGEDTFVAIGANAAHTFSNESFATYLSDGWFTSDVMMSVFKTYGEYADAIYEISDNYDTCAEAMANYKGEVSEVGMKAFKAAQEAKTFAEAIDATKDAVSSSWMRIFETIFGNYEEAKVKMTELSQDLWEVFASPVDNLSEMIADAFSKKSVTSNMWKDFIDGTEGATKSQYLLVDAIKTVAKEQGIDVDKMIQKNGSFVASLDEGWLTADIFNTALSRISDGLFTVSDAASVSTEKLDELKAVADRVINGEFGDGETRIKALTEAGYDFATVQSIVNNKLLGTEINLENLSDAELESIGYTEEQIEALKALAKQAEETGTPLNELIASIDKPTARDLIFDSLHNVLQSIVTLKDSVKEAWNDIFPGTLQSVIYNVIEAFNKLTKTISEFISKNANKITRTFRGLFAILDVIGTVIKDIVCASFKLLGSIIGDVNVDILGATANVGDLLVAFRDWFKENDFIKAGLNALINVIVKAIENIKSFIKAHDNVFAAISKIVKALGLAVTAIGSWISAFIKSEKVQNIIEKVSSAFASLFEIVEEKFSVVGEAFEQLVENLTSIEQINFSTVTSSIGDFISQITGGFSKANDATSGLQGSLSQIVDGVKKFFGIYKEGDQQIGFFDAIQSKWDQFEEWRKEKFGERFSWDKIFVAGYGLGLVQVALMIKEISKTLEAGTDLISTLTKKLKTVFTDLSNTLRAEARNLNSKALLNVVIAIGILVAAVVALSFIPDKESLWNALGMVSAIVIGMIGVIGSLTLLSEALSKLNPVALTQTIGIIIAITASLMIMTIALGIMAFITETYDDGIIFKAGLILSALMAVMTVFSGILIVINSLFKSSGSALSALIGLSVSILLVTAALWLCIQMVSDPDFGPGLLALVGVMAIISFLMLSTKLAGRYGASAATALVGISIAIATMVACIYMLGKMPTDVLNRGIVTVAALTLLVDIMLYMSSFVGPNAGKVAATLVAVGVCMMLLVEAVALLGNIQDIWVLIQGYLCTLGLVAIIALLIRSTQLANSVDMGMLIALMAGLGGIMAGLAILAIIGDKYDLSIPMEMIGCLTTMMILLMGATKYVSSVSMGELISLFAGFTTLLLVVSIASQLIDMNAMWQLVGATVILGGVIAGLMALTQLSTAGLPVVIVVMGTLTAFILSFAVASLIFANSVAIIAKNIGLLADGVNALGETITNGNLEKVSESIVTFVSNIASLIPMLATAIGDGVTALIVSLSDNAETIVNAAVSIVAKIITGMSTLIPGIVQFVIDICLQIIDGMNTVVPAFINAVTNIALSVINAIHSIIPEIITTVIDILQAIYDAVGSKIDMVKDLAVTIINAICDVVANSSEAFERAASAVVNSLLNMLIDTLPTFMTLADKVAEGLLNTLITLTPLLLSLLEILLEGLLQILINTAPTVIATVVAIVSATLDGIMTLVPKLLDNIMFVTEKVIEFIFENITYITIKATEFIFALIGALIIGIAEGIPHLIEAIKELIINIINSIAEAVPDMADAAVNLILAFVEAIQNNTNRVIDAGFNLIIDFITKLSETIDKRTPELEEAIKKLMKSMINAAITILTGGNVQNVFQSSGSTIIGKFAEGLKSIDLSSIVSFITSGFTNKLESNDTITKIKNAGINLGKAVLNGITSSKSLNIHSPSRAMDEIAGHTIAGFINRLEDGIGEVYSVSEDLGNAAVDSMSNALSCLGDLVLDGVDDDPVIKPVLDLSEIQNGAYAINDMLNSNRSLSLGTDISAERAAYARTINSEITSNGSGNSDIIDSIDGLRKDISGYTDAIRSMKLVTDRGTLVGELIDDIDNKLGVRMALMGRSVSR